MKNIFDFTLEKFVKELVSLGSKAFLGKQVFDWIYRKRVFEFEKMSNISKDNIVLLRKNFTFCGFSIEKFLIDKKDETTKFLFALEDNNFIEAVLMKFNYGYSICVSSQVGCSMGCKFCASGKVKFIRNLTIGEMVLQYLLVDEYLFKKTSKHIGNVVFMGIGEPLNNYPNLIDAITLLNEPFGIGLGVRHITVSTCGIPSKILKFAEDKSQAFLAISLHASIDTIRNSLMPVNKLFPLRQLLKTVDEYAKITKRRITFEYIMFQGINDGDDSLMELIKICKRRNCYVNLIPYNKIDGLEYSASRKLNYFRDELNKNNIITTIRLERGLNIDAACGQLRVNYEKKHI